MSYYILTEKKLYKLEISMVKSISNIQDGFYMQNNLKYVVLQKWLF